MAKATALLKMMRPVNGVMMLIALGVGFLFSRSRRIVPADLALGSITALCLNSSSNVMNDYFDRCVDAINRPQRPIPAGKVKEGEALAFAVALGVAGEAAALFTSFPCFVAASLFYALAVLYNIEFKSWGLFGNLLVSAGVAAPFLYGNIIVEGTVTYETTILASLAFIANTGREVVKGISDVGGDAARNIRTVARTYGSRTAALLASLLYLIAVALSLMPVCLGFVSRYYLPLITVTDLGFIYLSWSILRKQTEKNALKVKNSTLIWMCLAMISFIVGGVF